MYVLCKCKCCVWRLKLGGGHDNVKHNYQNYFGICSVSMVTLRPVFLGDRNGWLDKVSFLRCFCFFPVLQILQYIVLISIAMTHKNASCHILLPWNTQGQQHGRETRAVLESGGFWLRQNRHGLHDADMQPGRRGTCFGIRFVLFIIRIRVWCLVISGHRDVHPHLNLATLIV